MMPWLLLLRFCCFCARYYEADKLLPRRFTPAAAVIAADCHVYFRLLAGVFRHCCYHTLAHRDYCRRRFWLRWRRR